MDNTGNHNQTWTLRGYYANWAITITVAPPDDGNEGWAPPVLPRPAFQSVVDHFMTTVNNYENSRELEAMSRSVAR